MELPRERLPGRRDGVLAEDARFRVTINEHNGANEVQIKGNRKGLQALAAICSGLAELTPEQILTPANHYHLDEHFWGTEKGSVPLVVLRSENEWPDPMAEPGSQGSVRL